MPRIWTTEQTAAMTVTGKSLLVSAAAGSGKTATLTERIIRRVKNGADISRMLIVTFTRSAAAELRSRISEALSEANAEDPSNRHLAQQLIALGSADIQTIDSFCMGPVREHFERLGLSASFRIADDAETDPLKRSVMQDTVTDFYERYANEDGSNPFSDFADDLMTAGETEFPYDPVLDFYDSLRNLPKGIGLLSDYADTCTHDADAEFLSTKAGEMFCECVREEIGSYLSRLQRAKERLADDENYVKGYFPLFCAEEEYLNAILAGLDEGYASAYLAAATAPPTGSLTVKRGTKTEIGNLVYEEHKLYRDGIKGIGQKYFYTAPEDIAKQYRDNAEFCSMFFVFLSEFDRRLDEEKRSRGICEFTDVTRNMLSLLTANGRTPSDLADVIAASYDEVYIDEYQDVNEIQDLIFSLIGKDHRFMVGDIKQSIYAFRGSDPSLFANYRRTFPPYDSEAAAEANGNSIFMSDNFRCDRSIIDFSNEVCRPLFSVCRDSVGYRREDDLKKSKVDPSEDYVSPKVTVAYFGDTDTSVIADEDVNGNTPAPVQTDGEGSDEIPPVTEAGWIADTVLSLLHGGRKADGSPIRASDIAVLCRKSFPLAEIHRELNRRGIATDYSGGSGLGDAPEMKFLLNLLAVIDNPQADIPLYETLIHPTFGFSEDDLLHIRLSLGDKVSLFDAVTEAAKSRQGDTDARAEAFLAWLAGYRRLASVLPADRFLRELFRDPLLAGYSDSDAFLCAYDAARHYQNSICTGLYQFLGFFRTAVADNALSFRAGNADADAVSLMTIHSSKGLEFPVCFLAACGSEFSMKDAKNELICESKVGVACRLSDHTTLKKHSTLLRDCALLAYRRDTVEEEMRVLYVALTRAKERLYVTASVPTKTAETFLAKAEMNDPTDPYTVRNVNSFASWIAMTLAHCDDGFKERTVVQLIPSNGIAARTDAEEAETAAIPDTTVPPQPLADTDAQNESRAIFPADTPSPFDAADLTAGKSGEVTLSQKIRLLPAKIAASKVSAGLADRLLADGDGEDGKDIRVRLDLLRKSSASFASLLNEGKEVSATDKGTAAHEFLQFCNYEAFEKDGLEAEFDRLVRERFLTPRTAEIADRQALKKFLASDLFRLIKTAKTVEREVRFSLFLPYAEFTDDEAIRAALAGRLLHVQGSVDLLLTMPDGSLILADYKTDRIPAGIADAPKKLCAFFQEHHAHQLSVYRRAVRHLYGTFPEKTLIYSIPLGESVEIPF